MNHTNFTNANSTLLQSKQHWKTLQQTLLTNTYILLSILLIFGFAHTRNPFTYHLRYINGLAVGLIPPSKSCFKWIHHTITITNDQIFRHSGLDGLALVMLIELCLQLFVVFMILNVSILLLSFKKLSMINICYGSNLLWGHFTMATLMVFSVMGLVHHHWQQFSIYRRRYLIELRDAATPKPDDRSTSTISVLALHGRTVCVSGIPKWMNQANDPDKELHDFFERLFPGKVDSAILARDPTNELTTLMKERDSIRARYEVAVAQKRVCLDEEKPEPVYKAPISLSALKDKLPIGGKKTNAEEQEQENKEENKQEQENKEVTKKEEKEQHSTKEVTMTQGILKEMDQVEEKLNQMHKNISEFTTYEENTGYVVFLTAVGRSMAVQTLLTTPWEKLVDNGMSKFRTAPELTVKCAPEPRDIVHDNVGANTYRKYTLCLNISPRVVVMRCLSFLLLLFWAIPVALITALTQLDTLERYLPFIKLLTQFPVVRNFLSGFLPTVVLVQFMANLPSIFAYMAKLEGTQSFTEIDASATSRYVWFQIINVLFVSALTGGVLQSIESIASNPASLINLLGTAIPGTYMFFASYLMLMGFGVYPLELVRLKDLICKKHWHMKKAKSKRQWDIATAPPEITGGYAKQYGYIMLAFAITLEFATVAPMVICFGVLFFSFSYLILRHHIYYLYSTRYEGMGKIWPWLMFTIAMITIICQITLIGIFYGRKAELQALLTWPLVFLVLVFYFVEEKKHSATFNTLSMQELTKSENLLTKRLEVIVTSHSYAWLVGHAVPRDEDLVQGIPVRMPAAQIYLHPDILRRRLGKMVVVTEKEEKEEALQMKTDTALHKAVPIAYYNDVLPMAQKQDVQIFGQTFREDGGGKRRMTTANSFIQKINKNKQKQTPAISVQIESAAAPSALTVCIHQDDEENTASDTGEEENAVETVEMVELGASKQSGGGSKHNVVGQEEEEEEEVMGGWMLWLGGIVLAVGFIVAILSYSDELLELSEGSTC